MFIFYMVIAVVSFKHSLLKFRCQSSNICAGIMIYDLNTSKFMQARGTEFSFLPIFFKEYPKKKVENVDQPWGKAAEWSTGAGFLGVHYPDIFLKINKK